MIWLWLLAGWLGLSLLAAVAWVGLAEFRLGLAEFRRWRVKRHNARVLREAWEMYRDEMTAWEHELGRGLTSDELQAIVGYFQR
jgi:hypothetical protein